MTLHAAEVMRGIFEALIARCDVPHDLLDGFRGAAFQVAAQG